MARARTVTHLARRFRVERARGGDAGSATGPAGGSGSGSVADDADAGSGSADVTRTGADPPTDRGRTPEEVLVEEPLEVRVDGVTVSTTMRTPGHDYELAAGWTYAEGLLAGATIRRIRYCATGSAVDTAFNVVTVDTAGRPAPPSPRLTPATSSCGICGSSAVDDLTARLDPLSDTPTLDAGVIGGLADAVSDHQELFALSGASHAAAAVTAGGDVLVVREDIGRHNAVDKVVGRLLLDGDLPATGHILWVSGRASFEMVQKAWAGGFAALVSVSAPSSLAVRTAERAGLVLVGFARSGRFTVYAGTERIAGPAELAPEPAGGGRSDGGGGG